MFTRFLGFACAILLLGLTACGGTKNTFPLTLKTPTPSAAGAPVATTFLGTRPPGATPRATPCTAATPSTGAAKGLAAPPPTPASAADLQTTPSGLQYQDFKVGTGAQPSPNQTVRVTYTGWLENGTKFDSSLDRTPPTFSFVLGQGAVIKGWDEGVATMRVGGIRRLIVPPALGYGGTANGPIPANSRLTFDVELLGAGC
jgi:peptidylprolyl isomerase